MRKSTAELMLEFEFSVQRLRVILGIVLPIPVKLTNGPSISALLSYLESAKFAGGGGFA
jgi:hypothetical protein